MECAGADSGKRIEAEAVVELVVGAVASSVGASRRLGDAAKVVKVEVKSVEFAAGFGGLKGGRAAAGSAFKVAEDVVDSGGAGRLVGRLASIDDRCSESSEQIEGSLLRFRRRCLFSFLLLTNIK